MVARPVYNTLLRQHVARAATCVTRHTTRLTMLVIALVVPSLVRCSVY